MAKPTLIFNNITLIDFVKIRLQNVDVQRLLDLSFLDFIGKYNRSTSEIIIASKLVAKHHFCKITIYKDNTVMFTGSIHKMHNSLKGVVAPNQLKRLSKINNLPTETTAQQEKKTKDLKYNLDTYKGFNGNDFTLIQIIEVRNYLELLFNCEPHQMKFQNIEIGYNLKTSFTSKLFLKGLLHHRGKCFDSQYNGYSKQCHHQNIVLKIYDKRIQYGMQGNVLRTEIRIKRASYLEKETGIKTFEDITTTTLKKATELLKKKIKEVVYFDYTIDSKTFGTINKRKYLELQSPNFLLDKTTVNRKRPQRELQYFIDNYSTNLKAQILKEIDKNCNLNTRFKNLETCYFSIKKSIKEEVIFYGKNKQVKNKKCNLNTISYINVNRLQNPLTKQPLKTPKCKYTNLPLTHEKIGAIKIGMATVKWLRKNDPKKFNLLCSIYTSKSATRKNLEYKILKAIANKNRYKNTDSTYLKTYNNPNQILMFYN